MLHFYQFLYEYPVPTTSNSHSGELGKCVHSAHGGSDASRLRDPGSLDCLGPVPDAGSGRIACARDGKPSPSGGHHFADWRRRKTLVEATLLSLVAFHRPGSPERDFTSSLRPGLSPVRLLGVGNRGNGSRGALACQRAVTARTIASLSLVRASLRVDRLAGQRGPCHAGPEGRIFSTGIEVGMNPICALSSPWPSVGVIFVAISVTPVAKVGMRRRVPFQTE